MKSTTSRSRLVKGKRGDMEKVKEEEGRNKKMKEDHVMEIHRTREKKKGGNKERMLHEEWVMQIFVAHER